MARSADWIVSNDVINEFLRALIDNLMGFIPALKRNTSPVETSAITLSLCRTFPTPEITT